MDYNDLSAEARELTLFAENDFRIYQQEQAIRKNLAREMVRSRYDATLAPKFWGYWADAASQAYRKEYGGAGGTGSHAFTPAVRREAALFAARDFDNWARHNKAELVEMAGYKPKAKPAKKRSPSTRSNPGSRRKPVTKRRCSRAGASLRKARSRRASGTLHRCKARKQGARSRVR